MHPIRNESEAKEFIKRVNLIKKLYTGVLADLEDKLCGNFL